MRREFPASLIPMNRGQKSLQAIWDSFLKTSDEEKDGETRIRGFPAKSQEIRWKIAGPHDKPDTTFLFEHLAACQSRPRTPLPELPIQSGPPPKSQEELEISDKEEEAETQVKSRKRGREESENPSKKARTERLSQRKYKRI